MAVVDLLVDFLDPVLVLRVFYLAASALILSIQFVPALRSRFLVYGSRATPTDLKASPQSQDPSKYPFLQTLDQLAAFRVPHDYFVHFYILSTICALFWAYQLWIKGAIVQLLTNWNTPTRPSMTLAQVNLVWILLFGQSIRRLLESYYYTSKSTSQMWIGHYILGLQFYLTVNVAIFIEGIPAIVSATAESGGLPWTCAIAIPGFMIMQDLQMRSHAHLRDLKTKNPIYQIPSHPAFRNTLCPHYTYEVVIYVCIAMVAAPPGQFLNWTIGCAVVLVAVNLGVTAHGTKEWYMKRFGEDAIQGKSRMIPGIW